MKNLAPEQMDSLLKLIIGSTFCLVVLTMTGLSMYSVVFVTQPLGLAQPDAVDDRRMVELIGNDGVLIVQQRLEHTAIGIEGRSIEDGIFCSQEAGDLMLQFLVNVLRAADETHG